MSDSVLTLVKNQFRWQDSDGEWHNVDALRGKKGDAGPKGDTGDTGKDGATFVILTSSESATEYTAGGTTTIRKLGSSLQTGKLYFISAHAVITNTSGSSGYVTMGVHLHTASDSTDSDIDYLSNTLLLNSKATYTATNSVSYPYEYGLEVTGFYTCEDSGGTPYVYIKSSGSCAGEVVSTRFRVIRFDIGKVVNR